jgi:uncharacterized peroxidase-related enzyme
MEFIDTIRPEDAQGAVAEMYRRQESSWGYVPNYAKVFCHRPEVMARWGQLLAEIKRPMSKRRFELATFVAAHELANTACSLAHGRALREFFSDPEIIAIAAGQLDGVLDAAEQALVRFARQVARDASKVNEEQVAELARLGLTAGEIFDVAAAAAGRAFFTKMLDSLGVLPDSPFGKLDEAFRGPLTVGRSIDTREPARMPEASVAAAG